MEKRFVLAVVFSAVVAAVIAAFFYRVAVSSTAGASTASTQFSPVVCAATPLQVGARIGAKDLKIVPMPASLRPHNSFSRIEDVVNRPVIAAIMQDEPLLAARLAESGSGAGLAPMIPVGFRAVSLRVNDVIGVAGYAQPGMRVDVLVTGHPPESPDTVTRTVLQNVLVLSAGQVLQPEPKGQAISATLVTLLTTPEQAELLTLASDGGHIQLVLRNSIDTTIAAGTGAKLSTVYGPRDLDPHPAVTHIRKLHAVELAPAAPIRRPPEPTGVEIIRGSHRSQELLSYAGAEKATEEQPKR